MSVCSDDNGDNSCLISELVTGGRGRVVNNSGDISCLILELLVSEAGLNITGDISCLISE